jgi:hypothetical protein
LRDTFFSSPAFFIRYVPNVLAASTSRSHVIVTDPASASKDPTPLLSVVHDSHCSRRRAAANVGLRTEYG